jgi:hypothetical protein
MPLGWASVRDCTLKACHLRAPGYGNTNDAIGLRPDQPSEMRSDVPSHVTSVTTTTIAAIAIVQRRGMMG